MSLRASRFLLRQTAQWTVNCLSLEPCSTQDETVYERLSRPLTPPRFGSRISSLEGCRSSGHTFLRTHATVPDAKKDVYVLYKGPWMVPFYALVRLKVMQLTGFAALAIPLNACHQGSVDFKVLTSSALVIVGSAVASTSLWYYSKRYVGELALKGVNQDIVRFSVMDFWGKRMEEEYSLDSVIPPLRGLTPEEQSHWIRQRFFVPVDVIGGRQYFVSVKHGHLLDKELLLRLLDGRHLRDHA